MQYAYSKAGARSVHAAGSVTEKLGRAARRFFLELLTSKRCFLFCCMNEQIYQKTKKFYVY